ncbi:hypothetical protein V5799_032625 [Amblyomma americanum]|uniref:Uncharacterized protein n=1 Tax=Amblyomma americanum TaxID=6943 RepID=A0AAQ4DQM7_AMBAM
MNVIEEHSSLDVSPVWVLGFVFMMASMLVILYLFIAYLVYFINGMFALSSAVATLGVLEPLAYKLPCGTASIAKLYGLGLLATFLALILMRMAQPALLYLVPFTVLPTLAIAWFRGELEDIWKGNLPREDTHSESDVSLSETTPGDTFKNIEPDPRKLVSQPVQPAFQPAGSYGFALAETPQQNLAAEKFL